MIIPKDYIDGKDNLKLRIPYWVQDSIIFMDNVLKKTDNILEFGSGGSTLFFADRCKMVTSIENNKEWFNQIPKQKNIKLIYQDTENYYNIFNKIEKKYDCILIDPNEKIDRNIIIHNVIDWLNIGGYLVLDNYGFFLKDHWENSYFGDNFLKMTNAFWNVKLFNGKHYTGENWAGNGTAILWRDNEITI